MDLAGLERVDFDALGGPDVVTVNDLKSTELASLNLDLSGTPGGAAGDGQHDRVEVNGTDANDAIGISGTPRRRRPGSDNGRRSASGAE
jgi:hypothetical protein